MCKTLRTKNFRAPRFSWYSFGDICRPFTNPHISKTRNFIFSQNSPPSHLSTYAVVHRQPWPCAKSSELKIFVHPDFHGIHLGTFVGLSNPHISKTTNFIFSQISPPSHLCRGGPPTLAMCKTLWTQNFRAPRFSWYSFGDICRPFQPSHLWNHEFHFFTKLTTKQSSYAVVHRQPWPCANPSELKTFVHQEFHGIHLGKFVAFPTVTSQNPRISFFHKTPHQAI